jgi:endogenous inhibitor of DNA gyrase (YacG/DUF329 family)
MSTRTCNGCNAHLPATKGRGGHNRRWCEDCHPRRDRVRDRCEQANRTDSKKIRGLIRRSREALRERTEQINEANPLHRTCKVCGEEYAYVVKRHSNARVPYCSEQCRSIAGTKRHQGAWDPAETIYCQWCGQETERWTLTGTERSYCSKSCGQEHWKQRHPEKVKEWQRRQAKVQREQAKETYRQDPKACADCEREFPFEQRQRVRCEPCRVKHVRKQARDWHRQRYDSDPEYRARVISAAQVRRGRIKTNGPVDRIKTMDLFERDGWKCQHCSKKVSIEAYRSASNRAVIGHIVAIAAGGTHTWDNVLTLCHPCNRADGVGNLPLQFTLLAEPQATG